MSYAVGSVPRKGIKASEDGETVALLKSAGGIPLLVSNTPEFCTSWESTNLLTGRTKNPYDTRHSSGGSSGGEVSCLFLFRRFNLHAYNFANAEKKINKTKMYKHFLKFWL